jgi:hypothetical protein
MSVENLLAIALDPGTSPDRLMEVWNETKSSRVRKAVASNPNCSAKIACVASRLYIKEVVNNPALEMHTLFCEDKSFKQIYDAYSDPDELWKTFPRYKGNSQEKGAVYRAMLVSPKLNDPKIIETIFTQLSGAEFIRELKDPDVKKNVCGVIESRPTAFSIWPLTFFLKNKLISTSRFGYALSQTSPERFHLPHKGFCGTFWDLYKHGSYENLYNYLICTRAFCLKHFVKDVKKASESGRYTSDSSLLLFSNLYRDLLRYEVRVGRQINRNLHRSSYYTPEIPWGDTKHSHYISELIWHIIKIRNGLDSHSLSTIDLNDLYRDIKLVGFDKDYGPYDSGIKMKELTVLTGKNDLCGKILSLEDDNAFEFFMTSGVMWPDWYARVDTDNPESLIVTRLNRINSSKGYPYFNYSFLGEYPYVRIKFRNGVDYRRTMYFSVPKESDPPDKYPTPAGSGLLVVERLPT